MKRRGWQCFQNIKLLSVVNTCRPPAFRTSHLQHRHYTVDRRKPTPDFAFAFDIDGVLLRSSTPIPGASASLKFLQQNSIPFILLTNGGGKHETARIADLSSKLSLDLDVSIIIQSHTPFTQFIHSESTPPDTPHPNLKDKTILVCGGDGSSVREVAERYGFTSVVTPGDIYAAHPEIWPFSKNFLQPYYASFSQPLPKPINPVSPEDSVKIDAVFVYNDPRDWGLDIQLILDIMLSRGGILGTYSSKNNNRSLPNNGYLQDGQPPLYFSNPDVLWAAKYHLSRLGQGGFREALDGVWNAVTGGPKEGAELFKTVIGKPYRETYEFAEDRLVQHRDAIIKKSGEASRAPGTALKRVYMIGDNPESDIRGANTFKSSRDVDWISLLVRTGVYQDRPGQRPSHEPRHIVDDVRAAVQLALDDSGFAGKIE